MKKIIGVIACGLFLNAAAASSQVTDKEKVQMEKRIEKLIKKMTLEEKVGLLHGNSKFYVAGVERLGIPEWSLSDGPHGVRAEINRHDWAYAGWTMIPPLISRPARLSPPLGIRSWLTVGARCWARRLAGVRRMCCWARV